MKDIYVKEFKVGTSVDQVALGLAALNVSEDKNGKSYWSIDFIDKSGSITGRAWSEVVARLNNSSFQAGDICAVSGIVSEFRGKQQITVVDMRKLDSGEFDLSDFLPHTHEDIRSLDKKISSYIERVADDEIRELLYDFYHDHRDAYLRSPAATHNHHNFVGGLAEHVVEMLEISDALLQHYPEASADLVYAGIILHDVGKLRELEVNGFVLNYTAEGKLLGHITIGVSMLESFVEKHSEKFSQMRDSFKLALLKHIVLSHHSKLEYGSPIKPSTIEACIVSKIDDLSSEVRVFQRVLNENENSESDFSGSEFALDYTKVYLRSHKVLTNKNKKKTLKQSTGVETLVESPQDKLL